MGGKIAKAARAKLKQEGKIRRREDAILFSAVKELRTQALHKRLLFGWIIANVNNEVCVILWAILSAMYWWPL